MRSLADEIDPMWGTPRERHAKDASEESSLPFEWAGDVSPVIEGLWLVDDLLPSHGVGAIYGHPGSGKSFLAMDIGLRVALGWDVAGRIVEQGLCFYVCAEGSTGFRNRLAAFRDHHDIPRDVPFAFVPVALDLQDPDGDRFKLMSAIRQASERAGQKPALVIVDTLSKTFGGGKENTDDMASYIANCAAISERFKCCTLIVHHRPKDSESRDLRGHSSLRGGIETAILVEGGVVKTAETIKQKDGPDGERISFSLDPVDLGTNSRGKDVTTCLVRYCDPAPAADPKQRALAKLTDQQRVVFRAIGDAITAHGVPIGDPVPADQFDAFRVGKMVEGGRVADECKAALQAVVAGEPDKLADSIDRARRRNILALKTKGLLGTYGDWIWINH